LVTFSRAGKGVVTATIPNSLKKSSYVKEGEELEKEHLQEEGVVEDELGRSDAQV
jgi:hypothetical protein